MSQRSTSRSVPKSVNTEEVVITVSDRASRKLADVLDMLIEGCKAHKISLHYARRASCISRALKRRKAPVACSRKV